jgi:ABC-type sulfate/molybdate transport systems ATPase subunit
MNVALPLLMADAADPGDRASDVEGAVSAALARFGLEALAQKLPEELSGGQMQRVAMARAAAGQPLVILADEPTGQLDQATGQALLDALIAHLANTPTALVIATHDPAVSVRVNTLWRMERGGSPKPGRQRGRHDRPLAYRTCQATRWPARGHVGGVAVTVALVASLGTFIAQSTASMTQRASASLPVDWQVHQDRRRRARFRSRRRQQPSQDRARHETASCQLCRCRWLRSYHGRKRTDNR